MILNDGTSSVEAIKWNSSMRLKKFDCIDIAFYIEINTWKKTNSIQLNIVDIKQYNKIVDLQIHNRFYKCQLNDNNHILITNAKGDCISSNLSSSSYNLDSKQIKFAKKILRYAEIALGKAA